MVRIEDNLNLSSKLTITGGLASFSKLIIKGLANGDALLTTAYGIPTGVWQVMFVFSGPFLASKLPNMRTYVMAAYIIPTILATALLWQLPHTAEHSKGLLICCYISGSYVASLVIALQLPANNVGGYTKRVTSTALVFLAYCAGVSILDIALGVSLLKSCRKHHRPSRLPRERGAYLLDWVHGDYGLRSWTSRTVFCDSRLANPKE